jgi:hypothetical protein
VAGEMLLLRNNQGALAHLVYPTAGAMSRSVYRWCARYQRILADPRHAIAQASTKHWSNSEDRPCQEGVDATALAQRAPKTKLSDHAAASSAS